MASSSRSHVDSWTTMKTTCPNELFEQMGQSPDTMISDWSERTQLIENEFNDQGVFLSCEEYPE